MFVPYAQLLEQALRRGSEQHMRLVLKRMLGEEHRPDIAPALLERCAVKVLERLLDRGGARWADAADCLARVAWRARHGGAHAALWAMVRAVVCDLRGDGALRAVHLAAVTTQDRALAIRVLASPVVSREMAAELHSVAAAGADWELAVASYCAAMQRCPPSEIPAAVTSAMCAHQKDIASSMGRSHGAGLARTAAAAAAHLLVVRGDGGGLEALLARLPPLAARAQWPLGALAIAIPRLVAADKHATACQLLQSVAAGDSREFSQRLSEAPELDDGPLKVALVQDELAIRLQCHHLAMRSSGCVSAKALPMTAFFAPRLRVRLDNPAVRQSIEKYYADIGGLLQRAPAAAVTGALEALVSEASAWCYRLQSAEPLVLVVHALGPSMRPLAPAAARGLLAALVRALHSIDMAQFVHRACSAALGERRPSQQALAAAVTTHWRARYVSILGGCDAVRRTLLAEYLRRGVRPSPEELAVLQGHLASCGHSVDAWTLAASILPVVSPSMTRPGQPCRLVAQAYYEQLLCGLATHEPRRMLQLFDHLMGHHGVTTPEFRRRLADQAVVMFLRHGDFTGTGFYHLERLFIRHIRKPWFTTACLNHMRPRFWALHMFLRRRRYVPRFRLHRRQLYVHKNKEFVLGPTAIPSKAKLGTQAVDVKTVPVKGEDIDAAIEIYLHSAPRIAALGERSATWVLERQTRMVSPPPPLS
ncbi:hypothetical protein LPJ61_001534 [Coemansia biformis]|uniref:Uncharacterized protein n=1 Tax=Coemansia biformis TaxID=1286918 RepID=A0A9W8D0I7_9FUNG|nr:hypothetical protein LPJ61_001534 [Coemansia biformis]